MIDSTEINIDQLQALADAATPGPWQATGISRGAACVEATERPWGCVAAVVDVWPESTVHMSGEDAAYIAAVNPVAVSQLLAELQAAKADAQRFAWLISLPEEEAIKYIGFDCGSVCRSQIDAAMESER